MDPFLKLRIFLSWLTVQLEPHRPLGSEVLCNVRQVSNELSERLGPDVSDCFQGRGQGTLLPSCDY